MFFCDVHAMGKTGATSDIQILFNDGKWTADVIWSEKPQIAKELSFNIYWSNVSPTALQVVLKMPKMLYCAAPAEVSPLTDKNGQNIPGAFYVSNIYFFMGGLWQVELSITYADGYSETRSFDINLE